MAADVRGWDDVTPIGSAAAPAYPVAREARAEVRHRPLTGRRGACAPYLMGCQMWPMTTEMPRPPLAGVRILEVAILGPGALTPSLAALGADVVKIESPAGDYIRQMTWPIVEGVSLMHLHISRGKRSIVLDLRKDDAKEVFRDLVADADVVVEAMRPGALERLGLGPQVLREGNEKLVFASISGYGATGPYRDYPSHGIAYDTWAGVVTPAVDEEGFTYIPEHVSIGI